MIKNKININVHYGFMTYGTRQKLITTETLFSAGHLAEEINEINHPRFFYISQHHSVFKQLRVVAFVKYDIQLQHHHHLFSHMKSNSH